MKINQNNKVSAVIWIISVAVPVIVAILFYSPKNESGSTWVKILPHINSFVNGGSALALLTGFYFIRHNERQKHKTAMLTAFSLGIIFLVLYVIYHANSESTVFGDLNGDGILNDHELASAGSTRVIYLIILLSHILLAIIGLPLILLALYNALKERFEQHKKIVRFAFPVWLYVSLTGVIVYLMIRPYY